jgi:DNA-binding beta-propeller fold protein YncE
MSTSTGVQPLQGPPASGLFQGRRIVVVSDADAIPSAPLHARLGPREAGQEDTLTVIELPLAFDGTPPRMGTIAASNSVTPPPSVLAVDAEGAHAYVIETLGQRGPDAHLLTDLDAGSTVRAYAITDATRPELLFAYPAGHMPQAVSLHPRGGLLALAGGDVFAILGPDPHPSLRLIPVGPNGFGDAFVLVPRGEDGEPIVPSYVEWHPSGELLAACFPWRDEVRLYAAHRTPELWIEPLGLPIRTGRFPFEGRFTPDGRHLLTTDLQRGSDAGDDVPEGRVSVLRIDSATGAGEKIGEAVVGRNPGGLAVSRDGRRVVTSNLRLSHLAWGDPRLDRQCSLSLLTFDPATGRLETVGEELFDGLRPEGVAFDADGKFVVVTVFDHLDLVHRRGELRFFEVDEEGGRPRLCPTYYSIEVMRGPHTVVVV